RDQVEKIIAEVTKRVRETQVEEADRRQEGSDLPTEISEELEDYSPSDLQRALQKFKRTTHKYIHKEWVTPETTNPNFANQLKEAKVDTAQLINTIYRLTENTRVQARAATELFEHLKYVMDRGLQQEDLPIFRDSIEQARRLAVYGFGTAKQQEQEAREITTKALRLPHSLKHLETSQTSEKKLAFDDKFVEQYYEESYKQKLTGSAVRANQNRDNHFRGSGRGNNGFRPGNFLSRRGRGRGHWNQRGQDNNS
ncbi:hypothetical protein BDF21DRAFT_326557, partial [Thamnidium elegans]